MTVLNYYYLIYQFIMFLCVCWNLKFLLEPVGIMVDDFSSPVGTKNCTNAIERRLRKIFTIQYQGFTAFLMPALECWAVGTENDPHLYLRKKNED